MLFEKHIIRITRLHAYWCIGVLSAVVGVAITFVLIETDTEKIEKLFAVAENAVEQRNAEALEPIISPDYTGEYANSKQGMLTKARKHLKDADEIKIEIEKLEIEIDRSDATVNCYYKMTGFYSFDGIYDRVPFANEGYLKQEPGRILVKLHKNLNNEWQIIYFKFKNIERKEKE